MLSLLLLYSSPSANCFEEFNRTYYESFHYQIIDLLPLKNCKHSFQIFFPYQDNYTLLDANGAILVNHDHSGEFYAPLNLNRTTTLVALEHRNHKFEVYSFALFVYVTNGSVVYYYYPIICAYVNGTTEEFAFAVGPSIVALTITSVAVISSLLLLVTYSLFKKLRALPGQVIMNLAVAFLMSDIAIMVTVSVGFTHPLVPAWIYIVEIYFFHAKFVWMTIAGFEISRHIYNGMQLRFDGTRRKRQILGTYLVLGWGTPLIPNIIMAAVHYSGAEVDREIKLFGLLGRVVLFVPIGLTLLFNLCIVIFLLVILRRAAVHQSKFKTTVKRSTTNFARFFLIILTILGLSWFLIFLTVFQSDASTSKIFVIIFIIINSSQPLFVCLAFLGTWKVLRNYLVLCGCKKESTSSSPNSAPISSFRASRRQARRLLSVLFANREFSDGSDRNSSFKKHLQNGEKRESTSDSVRPLSDLSYIRDRNGELSLIQLSQQNGQSESNRDTVILELVYLKETAV